MRSTQRGFGLAAVAAAIATAGAALETPSLSQVAETTQHAPGTPNGVAYSALQMPVVDSTGTFLFESQLSGGPVVQGAVDSGVFLGKRGAVQLVARVGDVAPGAGGATWSKLLGVGQILRAGGRVAFPGELLGQDAAHDGGIWTGTIGNLTLLAREGDPAPGTTVVFADGVNRYFQDVLHLAMNDAGAVALRAKLSGAGVTTANDTALYAGTPGALGLVARLGAAAPTAGGATFVKSGSETFTSPSINASGQVLFRGHLTGTGVTGANADAIWYGDPATPAIVVRGGQAVSGTGIPPNSTLIGLGAAPPVVNDAGHLLFESAAFDGLTFKQAVWLGAPAALAPIAYAGQNAPDDSQNATFAGLFQHLRLNGSGQAAFHALLSTGANDWGLYAWSGSALRRIYRTGDPAPGLDAGETFGSVATADVFLNAAGKVIFRDTTQPNFTTGVWLADIATGTIQLLARTGATSNATVDGAAKQIIDLTLFSGSDALGSTQDGRSSPLGDDGTFAILAQFLDGHLAVLTNPGGATTAGDVTPSALSVGTTIDVKGSGFGGGAAKFRAPTAWLTVDGDPRKIPLRVDAKTATDTEFHATLVAMRKGAHGAATLHVLPRVRGAHEITAPVTIELPAVQSFSTTSGVGGDVVTITGTYFGSKKRKVKLVATVGAKTITRYAVVKTWSDTSITFVVPKRLVPKGATFLDVQFEVDSDAGASSQTLFTVNG